MAGSPDPMEVLILILEGKMMAEWQENKTSLWSSSLSLSLSLSLSWDEREYEYEAPPPLELKLL